MKKVTFTVYEPNEVTHGEILKLIRSGLKIEFKDNDGLWQECPDNWGSWVEDHPVKYPYRAYRTYEEEVEIVAWNEAPDDWDGTTYIPISPDGNVKVLT